MSASTDWASRPALPAMSAEELAGFVDTSVSRSDGLLFTATPTEELDEIGRWQQIRDRAFAGQLRAIVAAYNRAGVKERQFAADEVGLAIGATTTTGGNLVATALAACELPGLLEAVEAGQLTERHVLAVLRELDKVALTLEQRQVVVLVMLARFNAQPPGDLGRLVGRLVVQVDLAAAAAREAKATAGRKVWFSRDVDGQACLLARGPAAAIAEIRASLEATLPLEAERGDERHRDAREFDLLQDLLTGGATSGNWHAEVIVPFSVAEGGDLELAEIPGLGPILPATARDLLDQCDTLAQTAVDEHGHVIAVGEPIRRDTPQGKGLVAPDAVVEPEPEPEPQPQSGAGSEQAEPELRPEQEERVRPPQVALEPFSLVERALTRPAVAPLQAPRRRGLLQRLATPSASGRVLTSSGYVFPPRLRRFLEARDRTCVFPGCGRPARKTDKDHRIPWPLGATTSDNGQCLCRHHHRAKQAVFTVLRDDDTGDYIWISRGRWEFRRQPKGF